MAQHYLSVLNQDTEVSKPKRFTFFESRRASKWHQQVALATKQWSLRPVTTTTNPLSEPSVFPYIATQHLTKQYLGRAKSPSDDTDRRLLALIAAHGNAELAFAACAAHLSAAAAQHVLATHFEAHADQPAPIAAFLQAFVAAATCRPLDFALADRAFATILAAVAGEAENPSAAVLQMVIAAWKAGPPVDEGLQARAVSLTATVLHNAKLTLAQLRSLARWGAAREYRAPLSLLEETFPTAGTVFEGCVNAFFPGWRGWVKWRPRVSVANGAIATQRLLKTEAKVFKCLEELEGPDVVEGGEGENVAWKGLIRRGELVRWLESRGFKIGVGLIVGDTESLLTKFMVQFWRDVDWALSGGRLSVRLLKMYIEREGLDASSLTAWRDARRVLLQPFPKFVEHIVDPKARIDNGEELDIIAGNALQALQPPEYVQVRRPLTAEIAQCVQLVCNELDTDLRMCMPLLAVNYEWLTQALRLWHLRDHLAASTWLHHYVEKKLLDSSKGQPPARNLQVLKELHVRVRQLSQNALLKELDVYLHGYVLEARTNTKPLARALHSLWTRAHDQATREAGITLATLENVSVEVRCSCILAIGHATGSAAEQLQDRLLQVKAKVAAAYMDLTDVVVSLSGPLCMNVCWISLLWVLCKADAIFVDQRDFTDRGPKAYIQWIERLQVLFGGKYPLSNDIHIWLLEITDPLRLVLEDLEKTDGGKAVVHRLLTTTKPEACKWHLKLLKDISWETRPDRRAAMLVLLLSLSRLNADMIYKVTRTCAALSDVMFQRCQSFLAIARKERDRAAAQLAIWLNISELSPTLKAALIDFGAVLGLKESDKAWLAAKKHYESKVQDLVARARKLEITRMAMMRTNRGDVEELMEELNLEKPAGVAAVVAELPAELADVVEDVAEDQLELHFPLANLHSLTKLALGVQGTETVVVSLRMYGGGVVDAYCVHLEETVGSPTLAHVWTQTWGAQRVPPKLSCPGKKTRLSHVIGRAIWRELQGDEADVAALYARVKSTIQNGANECIVCAKDIGARLHRATGCGSMVCNLAGNEVEFGLRVEMVRHDQRVMDLLLTAVYAVAQSRNLELLPTLPATWNDGTKLLGILNALPSTEILAKAADMHMSLRLVGKYADVLVSWLCNAPRNYIISATGHWRIPNMPGIHQFLVVDNPPEIEAAFAKHNHLQPRMVLFHGTSMDRLYAILAQGLKVLSNTPLMKHGAASGPGIYFSSETQLPASYAAAAPRGLAQSAFFQSRKDFDGPQVLLGCEHAGPATKGGVFVVTDPTKVVVRYIFLVPRGVAFPMAKDIVAPMVSTFYSLRASAAVSR